MFRREEKRSFRRMTVHSRVLLRLPASDGPEREPASDSTVAVAPQTVTLEGECLNLSATGMSVQLAQSLAIGSQLEVELLPEGNRVLPLRATARVIRCQQTDDDSHADCWQLGLALENVH